MVLRPILPSDANDKFELSLLDHQHFLLRQSNIQTITRMPSIWQQLLQLTQFVLHSIPNSFDQIINQKFPSVKNFHAHDAR